MRAALLTFAFCVFPLATAHADWLITPYVGIKFRGSTNIAATLAADSKRLTIGGSVAILGDGVIGVEGDFAYYPRFFEGESDEHSLVQRSNALTLMGNVIAAVPASITRDSLRPYAIGGFGLMHAGVDFLGDLILPVDTNMFGMNVGGGAIGPLRHDLSARFEMRYFRSLKGGEVVGIGADRPRLTFWRATAGLTLRY